MKIAYAMRRSNLYPYDGDLWNLPGREVRIPWYKKVRGLGFDGIEIANNSVGGPAAPVEAVKALGQELTEHGVPVACVRGGGGLANPRYAADSQRRLHEAIVFASQLGCALVNTTVGVPTVDTVTGSFVGEPTSQGSSREASESDFDVTARGFQEAAKWAADLGIDLSIEIHQHSIADNSWSGLHLLELIDRPNVGLNPDLGNILWTYDIPEETSEHAIVALAPKAKYWHCKNLRRVHIPENRHTIFLRVPLPDGDIDYRFAISAMANAGYSGYLAIEGMQVGDHLTADGRAARYAKDILTEIGH